MKLRKNGFTLIEIIVSIALLGIMSMAMVTVVSNNFVFLRESKEIAEQTFLSQQEIELEVSDIKNQLKNPSHTLDMDDVDIDGVTVEYHQVVKAYNGYNYSFLVTPQQFPEYVLLNTFDVLATLKSDTANAFNVYPIATSSIMGSNTPDPSTYSAHWMMDIYQWYVSRPGFNIPVPRGSDLVADFKYYDYLVSNGLESELGNRYPQFPEDYVLIGTATTNSMPDLTSYGGRHVVFKVIPAAKSGRLGIPEYSEPVFISGLTNTTNLALHFDASYLDPSYVNSSNQTHVTNDRKVIKWVDLSSGIGVAAPTESGSAVTVDKRPVLADSTLGSGFVGRYVQFDANKNIAIASQNTSGKWLYVFSVAKGTSGSVIFQNGGTNSVTIDNLAEEIDSGWMLVSKEYLSNDNTFTLGNNSVDVAEVIVFAYSGQLTSASKATLTDEVSEYLRNKYVPLDTVGEIDEILPINTTVLVGQSYTPPPSALALMMSGINKYVPIVWENSDPINTTAEGVVTLNGWATNDTTKTVTLTVTINPVPVTSVTVLPTALNLVVGDTATLTPTVLPANATYTQINWTHANSSVATVVNGTVTAVGAGTSTIRATSVTDTTKYFDVTVNVKTLAQVATEELNVALASINSLTVNNRNSRNAATNKPTIITPSDSNGIVYTFTASTVVPNASITISGDNKSAIVLRQVGNNNSSNKTGTITLSATKNGVTLTKTYSVTIPRDSSNVNYTPGNITAIFN